MLFCHVTSHVEEDAHQGLLREKGGRGFPYLVWMDAEGEVLAKQGDRSVEGFQKTRATLQRFLELQRKVADGDAEAAVDALIAGIELSLYDVEQAKAKLAALGDVPADKRQQIDGLLLDLEVEARMASVRSQQQAIEAGREFLAMEQQGRVPTGRAAITFHALILEVHADAKDVKAYKAKLETLRKVLDGERNAERILKRFEARLEELEQAEKGDD